MEKNLEEQQSKLIKIVLFGPESTGKTTLSKQLAKHYNTVWVPEYSREYAQKKWDNFKQPLIEDDIIPIIKGQLALEEHFAKKANKLLICDTDVLETKVYCEVYYKSYPKSFLEEIIATKHYHFYFLTNIDVPWEKDDLRDKPHEREKMFHLFENALKEYQKPYLKLNGDKESRFQKAVEIIDLLIVKGCSKLDSF